MITIKRNIKMKVLLLGSGGREHALAWKIAQSPKVEKLFIAPGNAGTSAVGENVSIKATDFPALKAFALEQKIDMIVVGPEDPLVEGIYDSFTGDASTQHIAIIGPTAKGAQLEGSKEFAKGEILAKFFDDGEYTALFADGAVSAASGYAAGQQAYAVFQNGEAVSVKDVEKNIKVLELAAQTGCPVVTFYDSVGAKLAEGLDVLNAAAKLNATIAKVSGVVPQVAVVLGVCGGTSALSAANADVCIMAEGAELFFTAPFTAAAKGDKVADAGSAAAAAKAGVAAIVAADAAEAAEKAAHIVGLLPANNLTGPAIFEFEQPTAVLSANAEPAKAAAALIDNDSAVEMYAGFGKNVYTAFATIGGNAVGVVATGKELCHNCVAKASRFVRLCDAFSVPVLTIVNTEGFVPSTSDDIAGGIREAARLAATYADATTAKVALIAGKAVGPVYTALAAADLKIAVKGCTISALEPSAAVSVLYKDEIDASDNIVAATKAKAAAYVAEVCSADAAVAAGSADMTCEAANARASVVAAFELLSTKRAARLPKKHGNMAL